MQPYEIHVFKSGDELATFADDQSIPDGATALFFAPKAVQELIEELQASLASKPELIAFVVAPSEGEPT